MGHPKHTLPTPEPSKRHWVTQSFVAGHLGVSTRTVRDMTNDGRLRGYRINRGFVRYDLNEVVRRPDAVRRERQRQRCVGMNTRPNTSQADRDVLDDIGLAEFVDDPKLLHVEEPLPT